MSNTQHVHTTMVAALSKPGAKILETLTPEKCHLWHMSSCIQGEAGELFDGIKKNIVYNKGEIDRDNVVEELGDIEFYLEGLRSALGITREETLLANIIKLTDKNKGRYASGTYSDEQALERADKSDDKN